MMIVIRFMRIMRTMRIKRIMWIMKIIRILKIEGIGVRVSLFDAKMHFCFPFKNDS